MHQPPDPQPVRGAQALFPRAAFDLVAIAASTGGVRALRTLIAALSSSFPVPIAIVQHLPPFGSSRLAEIVSMRTHLNVKFAERADRLRAGTVFIAPPDRHLVIEHRGRFGLENAPKVYFSVRQRIVSSSPQRNSSESACCASC